MICAILNAQWKAGRFLILIHLLFFLLWLLPEDEINSYRMIRGVWVEDFRMYEAHAQMVRPAAVPLGAARVQYAPRLL